MADQYRYTARDLAEIFRRTERTIRNWRKRGLVPEPHRVLQEPYWTAEQVEQARQNLNGSLRNNTEERGSEAEITRQD
jgi:DNA-binding transcriptional MerR regulator